MKKPLYGVLFAVILALLFGAAAAQFRLAALSSVLTAENKRTNAEFPVLLADFKGEKAGTSIFHAKEEVSAYARGMDNIFALRNRPIAETAMLIRHKPYVLKFLSGRCTDFPFAYDRIQSDFPIRIVQFRGEPCVVATHVFMKHIRVNNRYKAADRLAALAPEAALSTVRLSQAFHGSGIRYFGVVLTYIVGDIDGRTLKPESFGFIASARDLRKFVTKKEARPTDAMVELIASSYTVGNGRNSYDPRDGAKIHPYRRFIISKAHRYCRNMLGGRPAGTD